MESVIAILRFAMRFIPNEKEFGPKIRVRGKHMIVVGDEYLDLALELVKELRRVGPFTLVEVDDKEAHVSIKLY